MPRLSSHRPLSPQRSRESRNRKTRIVYPAMQKPAPRMTTTLQPCAGQTAGVITALARKFTIQHVEHGLDLGDGQRQSCQSSFSLLLTPLRFHSLLRFVHGIRSTGITPSVSDGRQPPLMFKMQQSETFRSLDALFGSLTQSKRMNLSAAIIKNVPVSRRVRLPRQDYSKHSFEGGRCVSRAVDPYSSSSLQTAADCSVP